MSQINQALFSYIEQSPTAFQAVDTSVALLKSEGFIELSEAQSWALVPGGKYYTTRNGSSLIAFHLGTQLQKYVFHMASAHLDSPSYKVKPCCTTKVDNTYLKLNVEAYGGMIHASWLDRPLSLAGRVVVLHGDTCTAKHIRFDKDLLMICNVAPHMNREINQGYKYNVQVDMQPLLSMDCDCADPIRSMLSRELEEPVENILTYDLFLYNREQGRIWGMNDEFISAPRLDDLQCAFSSLTGFVSGHPTSTVNVCALLDNEEVGSQTRQGAGSTFLYDVLQRINAALGYDSSRYYEAIAGSFMISADNAHAVHPNHPELADASNRPYLNKGVVIKHNASQSYASDALSACVFETICKNADIPYQFFSNRSDIPGGHTLGNISASKVSVPTVDIGLPQLAMHSAYETSGAEDSNTAIRAFHAYFCSRIEMTDSNTYRIVSSGKETPTAIPTSAEEKKPVTQDAEDLFQQGRQLLSQSSYGTAERKEALTLLGVAGSLGHEKARKLCDYTLFIEKAIDAGDLSPQAGKEEQLIYLEASAMSGNPEALRFVYQI